MNESEQAEKIVKRAETRLSSDISVRYALYEENNSYSIKATVNESGESALVQDIAGDGKTALRIFELISCGGVTPCCIFEVTEDLIEVILEENS